MENEKGVDESTDGEWRTVVNKKKKSKPLTDVTKMKKDEKEINKLTTLYDNPIPTN